MEGKNSNKSIHSLFEPRVNHEEVKRTLLERSIGFEDLNKNERKSDENMDPSLVKAKFPMMPEDTDENIFSDKKNQSVNNQAVKNQSFEALSLESLDKWSTDDLSLFSDPDEEMEKPVGQSKVTPLKTVSKTKPIWPPKTEATSPSPVVTPFPSSQQTVKSEPQADATVQTGKSLEPTRPEPLQPPKSPASPSANAATVQPAKKVSIFSRQSKYFMMVCMIVGLLIAGTGIAYAIKTFGLSDTGKIFGDMIRFQVGNEIVKLDLKQVGYDGKNLASVKKDQVIRWIETEVKPKVEKPAKNAQLKGKKFGSNVEKEQIGYKVDMKQIEKWLNDLPSLVNNTKQVPLVPVKPKWTVQDYKNADKEEVGTSKKKLAANANELENTAKKLDGWVVDPGKTFSLQAVIEEGEKKAEGFRTLYTALSSALMQAGLKKESEGNPFDESKKQGTDDQFINYYNKPIVIKTSLTDGSLVVKILTAPGAQLALVQPDTQEDTAQLKTESGSF
ncbi:hypothetical protein [Thermoflavimicrobium dichotomicum]|uniref:Peptidoglycan binding domain-containing protein n=1 Tax=Thermoflavimicrobium dichotomicum TaxID=46223 RepID=A0A1I3JF33_9BACL|nr:hypothetical protein [Thermoflavimicrobium dichotomicum]SFI58804.1 hypothetical protein SAMN05421852_10148 [Thermoflavimicrobium dichotomicum]